jgi:Lon protease-like protein
MEMENKIPLFPLQIVIFPHSKYPLHIFETKYKKMLDHCLTNNQGFGIVAKVGSEISTIGSYVTVARVIKKYDNGELDIVVEGVNRFSINKIDVHENGYFVADVYEYKDDEAEVNSDLLIEIKTKFEDVLKKINFEVEETFWKNFINSETKSFKIAEKSGLSLEEQQELLSIQNENSRLLFLKDHFEKLNEQLSRNLVQGMVIMNDGYIN